MIDTTKLRELAPLYPVPPATSVPDSRTLQFLTDVLTAAGLLRHGKKDAGLATRIADESCRIRQQLFSRPPEQSDDQVRDAERYRWLRTYNTAKHPAVTDAFFLGDENLDAEIDAAIAAKKGGAA